MPPCLLLLKQESVDDSGVVFQQWLDKLNSKMKRDNRSILLFIDNCTAHPDVQFSNVRLLFLPPNTTSKLQPCDAGIIQATKMHYRKLLLRNVLFRMDEAACASDLAKSVNILDAIMWLKSAWDSVKPTTIQKCFARCGFNKATCSDQEEDTVIDSTITAFVESVEYLGRSMQILIMTFLQTGVLMKIGRQPY